MGLGDAVDKIVASALPAGLGGVYELYMDAPARRREEAWKEYIHDTVVGLAHWHNNLEDDEVFHDAVYHSTRIALGTHQEGKLEALRNALGNSVGPGAPEADEQARFFRYVDELSPAHIRVLEFLDDPTIAHRYLTPPGSDGRPVTVGVLLNRWLPEVAQDSELYGLILDDLVRLRLAPDLSHLATDPGLHDSHTTGFGSRFLRFISNSGQVV